MDSLAGSGNLCLKWNNHSSAFLKSISNIQVKERFCDATIACQGKYFPVHRIILSTCSDYFDEIFERMQCQHPYIVFKDIDPNEMELLLNYMYQGEVNVIQEKLPSLIKAAEALKIKGLAVPDDVPSGRDPRKRTSMGHSPLPKRRSDERRKRFASDLNVCSELNQSSTLAENLSDQSPKSSGANNEPTSIKEEPIDASQFVDAGIGGDFGENDSTLQGEETSGQGEEKAFVNYPISEASTYIKSEPSDTKEEEPYEEPSSSWRDLPGGNFVSSLLTGELSQQEDILDTDRQSSETTVAFGVQDKLQTTLKSSRENYSTGPKKPTCGRAPSQPHKCPYCPYLSYWTTHLKEHVMSKHTGERPFPCPICPKGFVLKKYLSVHMRTHTGEKPFECPTCQMQFSQKGNLVTHMKRIHHST